MMATQLRRAAPPVSDGRVLPMCHTWRVGNLTFLTTVVAAGSGTIAAGSALADAAGGVRGVSPEDQAKYAPSIGADGAALFRCLGSHSRGEGGGGGEGQGAESAQPPAAPAAVPFAAVNDDFCDCADGSDEPGTGACAGLKGILFFCPNELSAPSYVYTSRVNDGVCDCCDGSDEWQRFSSSASSFSSVGVAARCPNTCKEEGRVLRSDLERRQAEWRRGSAQRRALVEAASKERRTARQELDRLRGELPGLEARGNDTRAALEAARKACDEEDEQKRLREAAAADADPATASAAVTAPADAPTTDAQAGAPAAATPPPATEEAPAEADDEGGPAAAEPSGDAAFAAPGDTPADEAAVSEYAKWMDGAEALGGAGTVTKSSAPIDDEEDTDLDEHFRTVHADADAGDVPRPTSSAPAAAPEEEKQPQGVLARLRRWARGLRDWARGLFRRKTPLERARDAAEQADNTAKNLLSKNRRRIEELEAKLNSGVDDDSLAYSSLNDRCISKKLDEYQYEFCFFKKAKQDSISIGDWKRWEAPGVAVFDDGRHCPGGPSRSLRVRFLCGSKEEIGEVTEPSRCTYEATMTHPGACVGESPEESGQQVRMPTDEL